MSPVIKKRIQYYTLSMLAPFSRAGSKVDKTKDLLYNEIKTSKKLYEESIRDENKIQRLSILLNDYEFIRKDNNQLRQALSFVERSKFNIVAAEIINRDTSTWWNMALINKGKSAKILEGSPVITKDGLVGQISKVLKNESRLLLITDERCKVSAYVEGTREQGIISGMRGRQKMSPLLSMKYLSKEAKLQNLSNVFSRGVGVYPPDILIGKVIYTRVGDINAEAIINPIIDFSELKFVFVIVPNES